MNKKSYAIVALAVAGVVFSAGLVIADGYDEEKTGAGGGGWFMNEGKKDTFGFYLNYSDPSMSEFVLQARDVGTKIIAYQFDTVTFSYDPMAETNSAEAWGRAWVGGVDAAFHLFVEDRGDRSRDHLMVDVTTDVTQSWNVYGLDGGQIWVYLE